MYGLWRLRLAGGPAMQGRRCGTAWRARTVGPSRLSTSRRLRLAGTPHRRARTAKSWTTDNPSSDQRTMGTDGLTPPPSSRLRFILPPVTRACSRLTRLISLLSRAGPLKVSKTFTPSRHRRSTMTMSARLLPSDPWSVFPRRLTRPSAIQSRSHSRRLSRPSRPCWPPHQARTPPRLALHCPQTARPPQRDTAVLRRVGLSPPRTCTTRGAGHLPGPGPGLRPTRTP